MEETAEEVEAEEFECLACDHSTVSEGTLWLQVTEESTQTELAKPVSNESDLKIPKALWNISRLALAELISFWTPKERGRISVPTPPVLRLFVDETMSLITL